MYEQWGKKEIICLDKGRWVDIHGMDLNDFECNIGILYSFLIYKFYSFVTTHLPLIHSITREKMSLAISRILFREKLENFN